MVTLLPIRGVIFDLDGVLVRTDELHYQSWVELTAAEGLPFDRTTNLRLLGLSRAESLEIVLAGASRAYSPEQKKTLIERKQARFLELASRLTPADLLPGVRELVAELRGQGVRLAVGSSSRNTRVVLDRLAARDWFEVVLDGNDLTRGKPDPEVYVRVAELLALSPRECLVIEDSAAGVESACRAGMAVFGVGPAASLPGVTAGAPDLAHITAAKLLRSWC
jgi:beta-phosphoglucomutase